MFKILGFVTDSNTVDRHTGRRYCVTLVADANGDHLNAATGLRYRLQRVWV